ncbi:MAG: RsmD family RNA methyltransferase [Pseudomonadota bacterium]|nr:RsmD family RNA methyltransferase [Pseudomonadota bacterium]
MKNSDAINFLMNNDELFDIVFLDPPFGTTLLTRTLKIMTNSTLKKNAMVYVEAEQGTKVSDDWLILKKSNSKNVKFMLLGKKT